MLENHGLGDYDYTDRELQVCLLWMLLKEVLGSQMSGQGLPYIHVRIYDGGIRYKDLKNYLWKLLQNILRWGKDKIMGTTEMADYKTSKR